MTTFDQYIHYFIYILEAVILFVAAYYIVCNLFSKTLLNLFIDMHSPASKFSWLRGSGTIIIVSTLGLAYYQIYKTGAAQETLIIGLIAVAVGGKVGQKFAEIKQTKQDAPTNNTDDKL